MSSEARSEDPTTSEVTPIAKRDPGINALVSLLIAGIALAFTVLSIRDGFDVTARPWAEKRLWAWWLAAYAGTPALVVMLGVNFWRLARNGFVAIAVQGRRLSVFGVTRQNFALEELVALTLRRGALVFVLATGREVQVGLMGLIGGTEALIERIRALKPEIDVR